nr:class A beta-lactamase [Nocardia inohanensis]
MSTLRARALLALALLLPATAGCESSPKDAAAQSVSADEQGDRLRTLEQEHTARVGLAGIDTGTGRSYAYRGDERFGMGSTFKPLACAALLRAHPLGTGYFDQLVRFTQDEVVTNSPIAETRVATGMTVRELCDAAITRSDNTAGNQLLKLLGGPEALTAFLRSIGDQVTRLDRWEPLLNSNIPGDERDTTTPAALAADYRLLVVGDGLAEPERQQLTAWLLDNKTGGPRIRAGIPADWKTGDKTGSGDYGVANDVAVTWPAGVSAPLVIAVLTTKTEPGAQADNPLVAAAATIAVDAVR